jgi:hypothetical protein
LSGRKGPFAIYPERILLFVRWYWKQLKRNVDFFPRYGKSIILVAHFFSVL